MITRVALLVSWSVKFRTAGITIGTVKGSTKVPLSGFWQSRLGDAAGNNLARVNMAGASIVIDVVEVKP